MKQRTLIVRRMYVLIREKESEEMSDFVLVSVYIIAYMCACSCMCMRMSLCCVICNVI